MSEHTTLLRCPFCNGTPELRETGGWSGIGCNTNKCPAYLHALMFRTPGGAIAAWNRRSYATALCQQTEPTKAARDVLAERARQISAEGWTPEHDDEHVNGELAFAASSYAYHASARSWVLQDFADGAERYASDEPPDDWPDSWDTIWWRPKTPRRDLVRAAALLLAEIERLDRAARSAAPSEGETK